MRKKLRACYKCKMMTNDPLLCCEACKVVLRARECVKCGRGVESIHPATKHCPACRPPVQRKKRDERKKMPYLQG